MGAGPPGEEDVGGWSVSGAGAPPGEVVISEIPELPVQARPHPSPVNPVANAAPQLSRKKKEAFLCACFI